MLNRLWSSVQEDTAIALLLIACLALIAAGIVSFISAILEGRRAGVTTAAELRKDAFTAERRTRLKILQGRFGSRKAS